MHIAKAKLPKGMSYPLKSSVLAEALSVAGIAVDTQLLFSPNHQFFEAFFWPPNANVPYERLYLRTGTVQGADGHAAREHISKVVIPEFIKWAQSILSLPANSPSRRSEQHRAWEFGTPAPNSALLTDASTSPLRAQRGAAKRGR
jgi:hypothetical protein